MSKQIDEKPKQKIEQNENAVHERRVNLLEKEYIYDKDFYKKYNMRTNITLNKLGYDAIIKTHALEKGMEHFEIRPFGKNKTGEIMEIIKKESNFENYENKFSFINSINSLRKYKKIYEEHGWIDKEEYKKVSTFLKNYTNVEQHESGAFILLKNELEKDYKIDYLKFVKSRHSTRNYKNESINLEDIKSAVEMAKYTASACNRQYIKLHFYPSGKMRDNVINYALGKDNINLEGVNTFIITFDVNGLLGIGERNQGYFNAGLYSTNLVNSFHSLGIGTCFIEFSNNFIEEEDLKKKNQIPENERIAVILFAGYYDKKSIFTRSLRKETNELLFVHN